MNPAPFIALASIALIALFAKPAVSEIFECVDASGNVIFVNDRSACPDAKPHTLKGRVERAPSSAARAQAENDRRGAYRGDPLCHPARLAQRAHRGAVRRLLGKPEVARILHQPVSSLDLTN